MAETGKGKKREKRESKGGYPTLAAKRRAEKRYGPEGGGTLRRGRKKVEDAAEELRRLNRMKVRVLAIASTAVLLSLAILAFGGSFALRAAWGMRGLGAERLEAAAQAEGQPEARLITERLQPILETLNANYGIKPVGLFERFVADSGPAWYAVHALGKGSVETRDWRAAPGWTLAFRPAFSETEARRREASLSRNASGTWIEPRLATFPLGLKPGVAFAGMVALDSGAFAELAFSEAFALALSSGSGKRLSLEERAAIALTLGRAATAEFLRRSLPPESKAPDAYRAKTADAWTGMQLAAELWERIGALDTADPSRERLKAIWLEAYRRDYAGRFRTNEWLGLGDESWNDARLAATARSYRAMLPWMRRYLENPPEPEKLWQETIAALSN